MKITPEVKRPLRGAAAAQSGFDYQLDVSIYAALQLLLISKGATRFVIEPANEEDLEVDLQPHVLGRIQSSAILTTGYKLVIQIKMKSGEPWDIKGFRGLLEHGSDKKNGRKKALHHLDDLNTHYLLITNADAKGVLRNLLVEGFEEASNKETFPPSLKDILTTSPEGRIAIWGMLNENQLSASMRALMSDLLHVPKVNQEKLLKELRLEARTRTRGCTSGLWTRDDILETVVSHGGFLASSSNLEHFVEPANFKEMLRILKEKSAIVIQGPSGAGKTQAALKICDLSRRDNGELDVVVIGAEDAPSIVHRLQNNGPTLFYIEDPWGQISLRAGSEAWTEQLPRLLTKATPDQQFVITSRTDMMQSAKVEEELKRWSLELGAEHYRNGQLTLMHDRRMDQLQSDLQRKAYEFRYEALDKLETPLEIDLYFSYMQDGADAGEDDYSFCRRILDLARRDSVINVVNKALFSIDTCGASAIIWAMLIVRGQLDRGRLIVLKGLLRESDKTLAYSLENLVNKLIATRHLRQPNRIISFAHPSVREGFELYLEENWEKCENALEILISALTKAPNEWSIETAATIIDATRKLMLRKLINPEFVIDSFSQTVIDEWLNAGLEDQDSKFQPLLELASNVGSDKSIPSRMARWLLKSSQRGGDVFNTEWKPALFDDDWYETVILSPDASEVASRFIREMLALDHGRYGQNFPTILDRIAPNLTEPYIDAALSIVGYGFALNADVVSIGAMRDIIGYEKVVIASLNDLAKIDQQYTKNGQKELLAIEDGERDSAAKDAMDMYYEDEGYTSGLFIRYYIHKLRSQRMWKTIFQHHRVTELGYYWANDVRASSESADKEELKSLLFVTKNTKNEAHVWSAIRSHWSDSFEGELLDRINAQISNMILLQELVKTALTVAPQVLVTVLNSGSDKLSNLISILAAIHRAKVENFDEDYDEDYDATIQSVISDLNYDLKEIFNAFPSQNLSASVVNSSALKKLLSCATLIDSETLELVVPVIISSGGDATLALKHWLEIANDNESAVKAVESVILIDDYSLINVSLQHRRAGARRLALINLAENLSDPLPNKILKMASDSSSHVRQALVETLKPRPHPDHIQTLVSLIQDTWSNADPRDYEYYNFKIAQEAVLSLAGYNHLDDTVGSELLELARKTPDRILSQISLIVIVNFCDIKFQKDIWNLVNITEAKWIRVDALDALASAELLDPEILRCITPKYILRSPPFIAVSATHLVANQVSSEDSIAIFKSIASSTKHRALLLVGATTASQRDLTTAHKIIDLLEPNHPARNLLIDSKPLPQSILDTLGSIKIRDAVRKKLGNRIEKS